jgi:hypothetical protein
MIDPKRAELITAYNRAGDRYIDACEYMHGFYFANMLHDFYLFEFEQAKRALDDFDNLRESGVTNDDF